LKDHHSRVWELIGEARACMFVTRYSGGLRARPLQPRPDREAGLVRFVTDMRGTKDDEIEADPDVCLIFIDRDHKAYLSLTGRARIMRDTEAAARIWRKDDDVWWPGGPDDPNVRVIEFEPEAAELWDGPASEAVAAFEFAKARTTGEKPNLGENRKVTVDM
jgi:general stress protein 26